MIKFADLTGQKFGKLTVIKRIIINKNNKNIPKWLCKCECGNENFLAIAGNLINGHTNSCGCQRRVLSSQRNRRYNKYDLSNNYGIGHTSNGKIFLFDLEDYDLIKNYCWFYMGDGYLSTNIPGTYPRPQILMHRLIMGVKNNIEIHIDHINKNRGDNRKENLRFATPSQNSWNRSTPVNCKTGISGVCKNTKSEIMIYRAYITVNKKWIHLGIFNNLEEAIIVRLKAELKYFGIDFAPQRHLFEKYNIF